LMLFKLMPSYTNKNKEISLSVASVPAYLSSNPDVFSHASTSLKVPHIPHTSEANISSLIERQFSLFYAEIRSLKKR
jgi:uncharacterized protein YigA (DUF484 family)